MTAHTPGLIYKCDERLDIGQLCPLHAAAPELLAALERIIVTHDASCAGPECGIAGIDKARTAIARARGESK
jgi:hypothetical protein